MKFEEMINTITLGDSYKLITDINKINEKEV